MVTGFGGVIAEDRKSVVVEARGHVNWRVPESAKLGRPTGASALQRARGRFCAGFLEVESSF